MAALHGRSVGVRLATLVASTALVTGAFAAPTSARAEEPVDGAQTVGDAMFPHVGNGGYDAQHYDLDLTWSPEWLPALGGGGTFDEASLRMEATTTGAPLRTFSMDLRGFTVASVSVDGEPATFTRDVVTATGPGALSAYDPSHKYKLVITPATPVDGDFVVEVAYSGDPTEHVDADGSSEGWVPTTDGATFLGQPIGAMSVYPHNNTPADKATYTIDVDIPDTDVAGTTDLTAVSNGLLVDRVSANDRTTWRWEMNRPMASELMVISIGEYDMYEGEVTLSDGRVIPEWSFIDSGFSAANKTTFENRRPAIGTITRAMEQIYGPYPGESTGVVVDSVSVGVNYALETQDRSFFPSVGSFNGSTLIHEIVHQWYGDAVSPGLWTDIWVNEGMATWGPTYYNNVAAPATPNWTQVETTYFNSWSNGSAGSYSTPPGAQTESADLYGYQTYTRGAQFWEALHTALRRDDFLEVVRAWQDRHTGTSLRGEALLDLAEEISGRDLDAFWQDWILDGDKPAWPGKYDLTLTGSPAPGTLEPGDTVTHTLAVANVGRVALDGAVVEVDVADLLEATDLATATLPAGLALDGTTLRWSVPSTALAATSEVSFDTVVEQASADTTLTTTAAPAAASVGGLCTADCATAYDVDVPDLAPTADPVVDGTPVVSGTLTATTPGWAEDVSFAYRWLVGGEPVDGASDVTFEPRPADVGEVVAVEVTGTKPGFEAATRTSAPTAPVAEGTIEPGTPTITGDPVVGGTLTADPGTWDDAVALAYQWLVDGSPVADETGTSYTPRPEDVDLTVTVQVTGTRTGYASETVTSEPTAPVAAAVLDGPVPTISGRPVVDRDLVADPGEWGEGVTLGYQWLVGGTPVAGATEQTYRPTAAAVGGTVTVEVTGTAEGFAPATRTSEPTAPVEKATLTAPRRPKVGGTPRVGRQLKAKPGDWGDGVTLRYRWFADGERIEGRTGQRLRLTKDERGARIKVRVVGTRPGYTTDRETSRLTKKVRPRR